MLHTLVHGAVVLHGATVTLLVHDGAVQRPRETPATPFYPGDLQPGGEACPTNRLAMLLFKAYIRLLYCNNHSASQNVYFSSSKRTTDCSTYSNGEVKNFCYMLNLFFIRIFTLSFNLARP